MWFLRLSDFLWRVYVYSYTLIYEPNIWHNILFLGPKSIDTKRGRISKDVWHFSGTKNAKWRRCKKCAKCSRSFSCRVSWTFEQWRWWRQNFSRSTSRYYIRILTFTFLYIDLAIVILWRYVFRLQKRHQ